MDRSVVGQFTVSLNIRIRECHQEDLRQLEWFGLFTPHRALIEEAYRRHLAGENVMMVAEVNQFPVGQVWIDLAKKQAESIGILWALRVLPPLQGLGIGTKLIAAAEQVLRDKGLAISEIGVAKDNEGAKRLYERLGYEVVAEEENRWDYTTPNGETVRVAEEEWILQRHLG